GGRRLGGRPVVGRLLHVFRGGGTARTGPRPAGRTAPGVHGAGDPGPAVQAAVDDQRQGRPGGAVRAGRRRSRQPPGGRMSADIEPDAEPDAELVAAVADRVRAAWRSALGAPDGSGAPDGPGVPG